MLCNIFTFASLLVFLIYKPSCVLPFIFYLSPPNGDDFAYFEMKPQLIALTNHVKDGNFPLCL